MRRVIKSDPDDRCECGHPFMEHNQRQCNHIGCPCVRYRPFYKTRQARENHELCDKAAKSVGDKAEFDTSDWK